MARQSVVRSKRLMSQQKKLQSDEMTDAGLRRHSSPFMPSADQGTRARATVKDIQELFSALDDLVPKPGHQQNVKGIGHRSERNARKENERAGVQRRCNSEKYVNTNRPRTDDNMNITDKVFEGESKEATLGTRSLSLDRLFSSDTELELGSTKYKPAVQRHLSLPAYKEESENEMLDEADGAISKKPKFQLFHRRRRRATKTPKKKGTTWRNFFSTLSIRRKSKKKRGKNKVSQQKAERDGREVAIGGHQNTRKQLSLPLEEKPRVVTQSLSFDMVSSGSSPKLERGTPVSEMTRSPPEPREERPTENRGEDVRERKNTLETKSDEVHKKLSAWYKHAVKETNSLTPTHKRYAKSCEDLLTDTEVLGGTRTMSSDTESAGAHDRSRGTGNKTRVRKTRGRRNRRKERARWQSLPNVKLVSRALDEANKNTEREKPASGDGDEVKGTTEISVTKYLPTVKPVEAQLSFGTTLERGKSREEAITDFMKIQKDSSSRWLTRQCSKTTISCIRPLKLNLFYSESPSREAIHRSRSSSIARRNQVTGILETADGGVPHEFAFKIRRTGSSQRRRRRKSIRRQTRLPHQSPFYCPDKTSGISSKTNCNSEKENVMVEDVTLSKDSGLGSPDSLHETKTFEHPVSNKRFVAKRYSESEDSGWASRDIYQTDKADTAIQTDPVIVMTAVSTVRRPLLPHAINGDEGQSEA